MTRYDVVIVGAGHGGVQAAVSLRQLHFAGSIALLSEEAEPPYERPPLSKEYLLGLRDVESLRLRAEEFWAERAIALHLGQLVTALDPDRHAVRTAQGDEIFYGTLIWAAGGAARTLPCKGADLRGVHVLRGRADADAIRDAMAPGTAVAVVGAGYIGLEVAAGLRKRGIGVTVLEMADRVLARVAGPAMSDYFANRHRAEGVVLRLGVTVEEIIAQDGKAAGVRLGGGETVPAGLVIAGIGIVPATAALRAAGAQGTNGVDVDAFCRTSLADVYAIGDCAAHVSRFAGGARIRIESVQNATDQAVTAAKAIVGQASPYDSVPWFWSNQYTLRLQTVGLSVGADRCVTRADAAADAVSFVFLRAGRLVAIDCVNMPRDFAQAKALVAASARLDPGRIADASLPLKSLVLA